MRSLEGPKEVLQPCFPKVDIYIIVPLAHAQSGGLRNIASQMQEAPSKSCVEMLPWCGVRKAMLRLFRAAKSLRSMRMAPRQQCA